MKYTNKQIDERIYHLVLRLDGHEKAISKLNDQVLNVCDLLNRLLIVVEKIQLSKTTDKKC